MKRIKIVSAFLALSLLAAQSVNAAEIKVGVVNIPTVADKSPQKEEALARLKKEFSMRRKSLEIKFEDLRSKQEKLAQDGAILSADEREAKERNILSEQRELKRLEVNMEEDLSIRRNEELRKLEQNITQTITDLAKKESYDLVLYQGVIYAGDSINITKKVLEILKTK